MVTTNDRFTEKNRKFLRRIVDISQNLNIVHQMPSEVTNSESNSESESKSKEISDKRTQSFSNYRQTCTLSPQVHETYNVEMVKHGTTSETDEEPDGHQESKQTMVPSGKYLIEPETMCEICVKILS